MNYKMISNFLLAFTVMITPIAIGYAEDTIAEPAIPNDATMTDAPVTQLTLASFEDVMKLSKGQLEFLLQGIINNQVQGQVREQEDSTSAFEITLIPTSPDGSMLLPSDESNDKMAAIIFFLSRLEIVRIAEGTEEGLSEIECTWLIGAAGQLKIALRTQYVSLGEDIARIEDFNDPAFEILKTKQLYVLNLGMAMFNIEISCQDDGQGIIQNSIADFFENI